MPDRRLGGLASDMIRSANQHSTEQRSTHYSTTHTAAEWPMVLRANFPEKFATINGFHSQGIEGTVVQVATLLR